MFKIIGATVVYSFALFGLGRFLSEYVREGSAEKAIAVKD